MAKGKHTTAFVIGSLAGGLVGAAAALWNTPQTGRDLQEKILQTIGLEPDSTVALPNPFPVVDDAERPVSEE